MYNGEYDYVLNPKSGAKFKHVPLIEEEFQSPNNITSMLEKLHPVLNNSKKSMPYVDELAQLLYEHNKVKLCYFIRNIELYKHPIPVFVKGKRYNTSIFFYSNNFTKLLKDIKEQNNYPDKIPDWLQTLNLAILKLQGNTVKS